MIEILLAADNATLTSFEPVRRPVRVSDKALRMISANEVVKGIPLMVMFWGLWFA